MAEKPVLAKIHRYCADCREQYGSDRCLHVVDPTLEEETHWLITDRRAFVERFAVWYQSKGRWAADFGAAEWFERGAIAAGMTNPGGDTDE